MGVNITWRWGQIVLALDRISAVIGIFFGNYLCYVCCFLLCEVSRKSITGISRYLWISTKRKLCMSWRLDLMQTNWRLFGCVRKVFITHSFCKWPFALYNRLNTSRLARFRKNMKISKTQCWALFVISKATFTKTAVKPQFLNRFSLKTFSAAIDQCTIKSPNFVSIENFLRCLT